jgi:hypothetical protein
MPFLRFSNLVSIISAWRNDWLIFVMYIDMISVQKEPKLLYNHAKYTKVSHQNIGDILSRKCYRAA